MACVPPVVRMRIALEILTRLAAYQEYAVFKQPPFGFRVIKNEENLPWTAYLGVLGMAGGSDSPSVEFV